MKLLPKFLLVASVALNVGLVAWFWMRKPVAAPAPSAPTAESAELATAAARAALAWQNLPADNLPALVETLRAVGFPPELVRAIAAARLHEQYSARRRTIEHGADDRFWTAPDNEAVATQLQALYREEREALRQLVGPGGSPAEDALLLENRGLAFVSAERRETILTLLRDFDEQRRRLFDAISPGMGGAPGDLSAKVEAIERAQRAELARWLNPEELERYDLTASRTAKRLQTELAVFNPTEDEYRAIFKLHQAFDEQWGAISTGSASESERRGRFEAQRRLREQAKQLLSPERAAEYERSFDFNYRMASQLVSRLQLPPAAAVELYQVQKDIESRMTMRSGSPEEIQARLASLEQEAVRRVGALIGEKYVDTYRRYGGMWMSALKMNPAASNQGSAAPVLRLNTGG